MGVQKTVKEVMKVLSVGGIVALDAIFLLQLIYYQYDFEKTIAFIDYQTRLSFLQIGVIFIIFLWLYFLSTSVGIATLLLVVFSAFIGIATQQKILYRGEPVYPSDVYFLKDIKFLLEMIDIKIVVFFFSIIGVLITGIVIYFMKREKKSKTWAERAIRFMGLITTSLCLFYMYQFNQPGNKVKALFNEHASWIAYSQERNYSQNGVVSGIMYNLKSPAVDKPDKYSEETLIKIYEKYSRIADIVNEDRNGSLADYNIIFVMNETFSDPTRVEGMTISPDPLQAYRELNDQYLSGMSLSQGYGGGTANIEFEALTGVSLEPLATNITTPFIQLSNQMQQLPSFVDLVKETNHTHTAMHPYNSSMYKRKENYQSLGFEQALFEENFQFIERIDENNFISDKSAYLEILDVMNKTENKDFIHLVTMNNHKPHVNKYQNVEFEVSGAPYNLEVAHYAKGVQYSSVEFSEFLTKLDQLEEKTIVVFWGDHLPSFYGEELFKLNGHVKMHETPLLFYTNFSEDSRDIGTISPIYFANHVLEIANAPVTPYIALLDRLEEILPAFEKGIYLERETDLKYDREDLKPSTQKILNEYEMVLYDITTGKNYSKKLGIY